MPVLTKPNKRIYPRIKVNELILDRKTHLIRDTIKNISGNGCFIQTDSSFDIGEVYQLNFQLKEQETVIKLNGEIVWEYQGNPADTQNHHGYGVKFLEVSPKDVQNIIDAIIYFKVNKIYN